MGCVIISIISLRRSEELKRGSGDINVHGTRTGISKLCESRLIDIFRCFSISYAQRVLTPPIDTAPCPHLDFITFSKVIVCSSYTFNFSEWFEQGTERATWFELQRNIPIVELIACLYIRPPNDTIKVQHTYFSYRLFFPFKME